MQRINEIIPGKLFLGPKPCVKEELEVLGIKYVLNLSMSPNSFDRGQNEFVFKSMDLSDNANENIIDLFEEAHNFIDQDGRVLVHCQAGISRSSAVVISYLMRKYNMSLREAFMHVKQRRSVILPNEGFFRQLICYENQLGAVCDGNCRHQCTKRTAQSFSYLEYVVMIMKEEFPHLDERVLRNFIQSNDLLDRSLEEVYEVISKSELLRPAHLSNS